MYKDKKILAIIPARSGSKGLKNKNVKILNGKPLIAYSIEEALKSKIIDRIIVSTDSEEYASIARTYGAEVPFIRDAKLSEDNTKTKDVILNTIEKIEENFDYFILLQPTSPLRKNIHIKEALELAINDDLESVISVCEINHSINLINKLDENKSMYKFIKDDKRRQECEIYYSLNGAIYISKINSYLKTNDFYSEKSKAYLMDKYSSIDIDDSFDFEFAEFIMKNNY